MRLIDADAMHETLKRKYPQWFTEKPKDSWMHYAWLVYYWAVENAPAVDAVPVVRCKDCKYYHQTFCEIWSKYGTIQTREQGFCYMAERRDDE